VLFRGQPTSESTESSTQTKSERGIFRGEDSSSLTRSQGARSSYDAPSCKAFTVARSASKPTSASPPVAIAVICSLCFKARAWFAFAKGAERFRLPNGADALSEYRWTERDGRAVSH
jgi:hypothetical protein